MEPGSPLYYLILLIGGLLAGVINTLSGYGSIITLSLLMDVAGLPANVANGSNRIGVLAAGTFASLGFYKEGKLNFKKSRVYVVLTFLGAICGVYMATIISNEGFRTIFKYLSVVMLLIILVNPKKWLITESKEHNLPYYILAPAFLLAGFYGGFIQMGLGLILLSLMVLMCKIELLEANGIKALIIVAFSIMAIFLFQMYGLIDWKAGSIIAIGQATGAYFTSTYISRIPSAQVWAYRMLVLIVVSVVIYQFSIG